MGISQSCCGAQNDQKEVITKPSNTLHPNRSSSVPHILKEGTPAYESVVTPKHDRSNGHVSEKSLLEILQKPSSVSSNLQNVPLTQDAVLAKTVTTPQLDRDASIPAPQQIWEHTQSLDTIKLLTSERENYDEVSQNEFIELRVKHGDGAVQGSSEIVYLRNGQETTDENTCIQSSKIAVQEDHKLGNDENKSVHECSTIVERTSNSSGTTTSPNSKYYNIFDVEFRRHTEQSTKSNFNTFSSTYRASTTPSPKVVRHSSPEARKHTTDEEDCQKNQVQVEAEINENGGVLTKPTINHNELQEPKLYSSIVKEGTLTK